MSDSGIRILAVPALRVWFRQGAGSVELISCVRRCAGEVSDGRSLPVEVIVDFDAPGDVPGCCVRVTASGEQVTERDPDPFVAVERAFALLSQALVERLPLAAE